MGYHTMRRFVIDRKALTISYMAVSSNSYDSHGRRETITDTETFKTMEDLENRVLNFAQGHLDGTTQFAPSSTMVKRINWLQDHDFVEKADRKFFVHYTLKDCTTTREVLTGKRRVKTELYQFYSKYGEPVVYDGRSKRVTIYSSESHKKATKVTNHLAEELEAVHKEFFEFHGVHRVLVKE